MSLNLLIIGFGFAAFLLTWYGERRRVFAVLEVINLFINGEESKWKNLVVFNKNETLTTRALGTFNPMLSRVIAWVVILYASVELEPRYIAGVVCGLFLCETVTSFARIGMGSELRSFNNYRGHFDFRNLYNATSAVTALNAGTYSLTLVMVVYGAGYMGGI